jgi:hypothetical protein
MVVLALDQANQKHGCAGAAGDLHACLVAKRAANTLLAAGWTP